MSKDLKDGWPRREIDMGDGTPGIDGTIYPHRLVLSVYEGSHEALMLGLLVHGDNHFVVRGPEPSAAEARALARHWSVIQIGGVTPADLAAWRISTREFRQELQWAVVVPGVGEMNPAVRILLDEMVGRGVVVRAG